MNFNRNHSTLQQVAAAQFSSNLVTVEIRNWQGGSKDDLVSFISRKTRIPLLNAKVTPDGAVEGQVKTSQDADALIKWTGVRFAGSALKITKQSSTNTSNAVDILKRFLHRRYNPEAKLLDLTNIASDAELQSTGAFNSLSTQSKMFPALMKLAGTEKFNVESVNLSQNNLQDINGITTLSTAYPNLINLSLADNAIAKPKSLELWKNKFKRLRELILLNNPITSSPSYLSEVSKVFPRLVILDGNVIRDESKLTKIYQLPLLKKQFFFEDPEIQNLSTQFISNFLQFWDNDRSQLMQLYTNDSQFSISVDSSVPNDAEASKVAFGYYMSVSRNVIRVSTEKLRQQRLGKGPEEIFKLFKNLPKTKHKLTESPSSYSIEAWRYQHVNGFMISLHGEFEETAAPEIDSNTSGNQRNHRRAAITPSTSNKLTPKSFDRTFVIVPNGNGLIVASDLLIVRPLASSATAWVEEPIIQQQQPPIVPTSVSPGITPPPSSSGLQLPPGISLTPDQEQTLTKLLLETKLNLQFSLLLAEQSGWNYETAVNGFKQSHASGQIPPEAFQ